MKRQTHLRKQNPHPHPPREHMRMTGTRSTLFLLAGLFLLVSAVCRPPVRQQELRVLISARNMLETQNPFRPEFQNQPRYRKPPLPYWMAALPMTLGLPPHVPLTGRLLFLATSLLTLWLTARMAGKAGDWAAFLLILSYGFWRFAGLAETDIPNLLGLVLAFWGWKTHRPAFSAGGMILAALSKGPAGIAIPLISFVFLQKNNPHSRSFWLKACIPAFIAGLSWVAFLWLDPQAQRALQHEIRDTFFHSAHARHPFYYFLTLPLLFLPSLLLLLRVRLSRNCFQHLPRIPMVWFLTTFALLTLTVSKQNHYALMLMPPAAWLVGDILSRHTLRIPIRSAVILLSIALLAELPRSRVEAHARNARFLNETRPLVQNAPILHVVGVNSARFDFHSGRHVDNTDSAREALGRAAPGEHILIVQRRKHFDADTWPREPESVADDPQWIRRHYATP